MTINTDIAEDIKSKSDFAIGVTNDQAGQRQRPLLNGKTIACSLPYGFGGTVCIGLALVYGAHLGLLAFVPGLFGLILLERSITVALGIKAK